MKKEDIKELMKLFSSTENIARMKLKQDDLEIELEKETNHIIQTPIAPATQVLMPQQQEIQTVIANVNEVSTANVPCVTSPMVGTFYRAPAPGAKPFVQVGDSVSKGQVVAIIEAMKIMNEIDAEYDCKIVKILVEDGQPVEFNMPLFEVEKL